MSNPTNPWDDEVIPNETDNLTVAVLNEDTSALSVVVSPTPTQTEKISSEVQWHGHVAQEAAPALFLHSTTAPPQVVQTSTKVSVQGTHAPKKTSSHTSSSSSASSSSTTQWIEKTSACSEKIRNHGYRSALIGFVSAIARLIILPSTLLRQVIFSAVGKESLQRSETTSRLYLASVGFVLIDVAPLAVLFGLLYIASSLAFMIYISPLVYFTHALALCLISCIPIPIIYTSLSSSIRSEQANERKETKDGSGKRSSRSSSGGGNRRITLLVIIVLFLMPLAVATTDVLIGLIASNYLYDQSIILSMSFALVTRCSVQIPIVLFAISVGYALQYYYMIHALHQDAIQSNNAALISELCSRGSERRLKFGGDSSKVARYLSALWLGDDSIAVPRKSDYGAIKTIQTLITSKPEHLDRKLSRFIAIFIINPIAWIDCSDHVVARFVRLMSESDLIRFGYHKILKERNLMFAFLESPAIPLYSSDLHCNPSLRIEALKKCHVKTE
jgi:hypothetical protein